MYAPFQVERTVLARYVQIGIAVAVRAFNLFLINMAVPCLVAVRLKVGGVVVALPGDVRVEANLPDARQVIRIFRVGEGMSAACPVSYVDAIVAGHPGVVFAVPGGVFKTPNRSREVVVSHAGRGVLRPTNGAGGGRGGRHFKGDTPGCATVPERDAQIIGLPGGQVVGDEEIAVPRAVVVLGEFVPVGVVQVAVGVAAGVVRLEPVRAGNRGRNGVEFLAAAAGDVHTARGFRGYLRRGHALGFQRQAHVNGARSRIPIPFHGVVIGLSGGQVIGDFAVVPVPAVVVGRNLTAAGIVQVAVGVSLTGDRIGNRGLKGVSAVEGRDKGEILLGLPADGRAARPPSGVAPAHGNGAVEQLRGLVSRFRLPGFVRNFHLRGEQFHFRFGGYEFLRRVRGADVDFGVGVAERGVLVGGLQAQAEFAALVKVERLDRDFLLGFAGEELYRTPVELLILVTRRGPRGRLNRRQVRRREIRKSGGTRHGDGRGGVVLGERDVARREGIGGGFAVFVVDEADVGVGVGCDAPALAFRHAHQRHEKDACPVGLFVVRGTDDDCLFRFALVKVQDTLGALRTLEIGVGFGEQVFDVAFRLRQFRALQGGLFAVDVQVGVGGVAQWRPGTVSLLDARGVVRRGVRYFVGGFVDGGGVR